MGAATVIVVAVGVAVGMTMKPMVGMAFLRVAAVGMLRTVVRVVAVGMAVGTHPAVVTATISAMKMRKTAIHIGIIHESTGVVDVGGFFGDFQQVVRGDFKRAFRRHQQRNSGWKHKKGEYADQLHFCSVKGVSFWFVF